MMSVIVRDENENLFMFSKGADSAILPRLKHDSQEIKSLKMRNEQFSKQGLRTIFIAMKQI